MNAIISFICGLIFAAGLGISQMTKPTKVIGFLDVFGSWDPSLAFVMVGAIGFHFFAYLLIKRMKKPKLAEKFDLPEVTALSPSLLIGALLFGAGWGIGGFCPGPALVSITSGMTKAFVFCGAMFAGFVLFSVYSALRTRSSG